MASVANLLECAVCNALRFRDALLQELFEENRR